MRLPTNDVRRLGDADLKKHAASARKRARVLAGAEPGTSAARTEQLDELKRLSAFAVSAEGELGRRAFEGQAYAWKAARSTDWALEPARSGRRRRSRRGKRASDAAARAFWLLRYGLPSPLIYEEIDTRRLSDKEGEELLALTQRILKGGISAKEQRRWEDLLEQAADRPGQIAQARAQGF